MGKWEEARCLEVRRTLIKCFRGGSQVSLYQQKGLKKKKTTKHETKRKQNSKEKTPLPPPPPHAPPLR